MSLFAGALDDWDGGQGLGSSECVEVSECIFQRRWILCVRYLSDVVHSGNKYDSCWFSSVNLAIFDDDLVKHGQLSLIREVVPTRLILHSRWVRKEHLTVFDNSGGIRNVDETVLLNSIDIEYQSLSVCIDHCLS